MAPFRVIVVAAAALTTALASGTPSSALRGAGGVGEDGSSAAVSGPGAVTSSALPRTEDRGWVRGVVVDSAGRPVSGALVNVLTPREVPEAGVLPDNSARRTWTGPRGGFRVRQARLPFLVQVCPPDRRWPSSCRETAQGVPYLWTYAGPAGVTDSWVTQTSLFRPSSKDRRLGRVKVVPQSVLSGRIEGAAHQEVRIMRLNDTMAFRARTDAEGRYRFGGLAAGRYYLAAGGDGWLPWRSEPFALDRDAKHRVNGAVQQGAVIEGTAESGDAPARFTDILVKRVGHGLIAAATTDEQGRFTVSGLVPARYRIGILYDGGEYTRTSMLLDVEEPSGTYRPTLRLRRGGVLTVDLVTRPGDDGRVRDELRDASGTPIQPNRNFRGKATYTGLRPGTYTVVAATKSHFGLRTVEVPDRGAHTVQLPLDQETLTLRGRTAPRAVVEATTGDLCPPDGPQRYGGFHAIERADRDGSYVLTGLVPGTLMLGADGWPRNYGPRCWSGVELTADTHRDLPLRDGSSVSGRLVYEATGTPVITQLSYELFFPRHSVENPTGEHPARDRAEQATGEFTILSMNPASVTGRLATEADWHAITSLRFAVTHPYQDGTPYWLDTAPMPLTLAEAEHVDLGDIPVRLYP